MGCKCLKWGYVVLSTKQVSEVGRQKRVRVGLLPANPPGDEQHCINGEDVELDQFKGLRFCYSKAGYSFTYFS